MLSKHRAECAACGFECDPLFEAPKRTVQKKITDAGNHTWKEWVAICPRCGKDLDFKLRVSPEINRNIVN